MPTLDESLKENLSLSLSLHRHTRDALISLATSSMPRSRRTRLINTDCSSHIDVHQEPERWLEQTVLQVQRRSGADPSFSQFIQRRVHRTKFCRLNFIGFVSVIALNEKSDRLKLAMVNYRTSPISRGCMALRVNQRSSASLSELRETRDVKMKKEKRNKKKREMAARTTLLGIEFSFRKAVPTEVNYLVEANFPLPRGHLLVANVPMFAAMRFATCVSPVCPKFGQFFSFSSDA